MKTTFYNDIIYTMSIKKQIHWTTANICDKVLYISTTIYLFICHSLSKDTKFHVKHRLCSLVSK